MFGRKERKTAFKREPAAELEDLRDDCIALFLNSGLNYEQVHAAGGPTGPTVSKWLHGETHFPRLDTMRALIRAVGGEITITGSKLAEQLQGRSQTGRLNLPVPIVPKMDLAAHNARKSRYRSHRNRRTLRNSARAKEKA